MRIVVVSGGFDPLHAGHIAMLREAESLGDYLIVGINSDEWLSRKKGKNFLSYSDRASIIKSLIFVDEVIIFNDNDNTACDLLYKVKYKFPHDTIIFANGGDRTKDNIPEMNVGGVEFIFGVGGSHKINSSSEILTKWKENKTDRPWGYYKVIYDIPGVKVKELVIEPFYSLSMQRHFFRSEHWIVAEGKCVVNSRLDSGYNLPSVMLKKHESYDITVGEWHQLCNPFVEPCHIIEIQYGEKCIEEDISRI